MFINGQLRFIGLFIYWLETNTVPNVSRAQD